MQAVQFNRINVMKLLFLTLCAGIMIFLPSSTEFKKHSLKGKVMFDAHEVAPDATVSILKADDKSLISSGISNVSGEYSFGQLKPGKYYVAAGTFGNPLKVVGPIEVKETEKVTIVPPIVVSRPANDGGPVIKTTRISKPLTNKSLKIT
ncbi:MAG: carboxypeptidase-like regulatory domain-containing protein [Saprospiraceae bacterium]|jgi:hypothetical protein|nr:carboxypeptidase regulatory-like domain-containing protein [Saprospiraceae bacterium]MCO5277500.1 carboxypeptidase-like regulatory domain-containing protein [Saprospiraceae bacterium]